MRNSTRRGCGPGAAALAVALVSMLAGCGPRVGGPAPVIDGGAASGQGSPPQSIVVQRGQTLSGIAQAYHVPMQAIADANHLSPPYRIAAGSALTIPGSGEPASPSPPVSVAALPPAGPATALPPAAQPAPLAPPAPAAPAKPLIAAAPLPAPPGPPPASPPEAAAAPAPAPAPPTEPRPTAAPPPAASAALSPPAATPPHNGSGAFLWPVRGRVLEGYGSGANGTHNDGINIAAPRGAAVQAVDAGVVAYAGNELRGYGNLILVKHAGGWISAYAHCDLILVKKGEKVGRGQVIARVGATGNVSEPQLHFELRRGDKPVDPQQYLATPTAAAKDPRSG